MYTYDGSLTTPPCTQAVKWMVVQEVQNATQAQIDAFKAPYADNADYSNGNSRVIQPIYNRNIHMKVRPEASNAVYMSVAAGALATLAANWL